ncbi:hypothetical protein MKW92_013987, partial [Papaver armeniacum]
FVYDPNRMSVIQVNSSGFENCNEKDPIQNWSSPTGADVVPLSKAGKYYFIAGDLFCFEGVKLY